MRMITNLVIPLLLSGLSSTAEQGTHNSLVGGSNPSGRNLYGVRKNKLSLMERVLCLLIPVL